MSDDELSEMSMKQVEILRSLHNHSSDAQRALSLAPDVST